MIRLDRWRRLRLTPGSIKLAEECLGKSIKEIGDWIQKSPPSTERLSMALWILLIDEDPGLTVEDVKQILIEHLSGGWSRLRVWRLKRAYDKYARALKEFGREFGIEGAK
jgi:hypothetical protein